jgi:hypothetical protein
MPLRLPYSFSSTPDKNGVLKLVSGEWNVVMFLGIWFRSTFTLLPSSSDTLTYGSFAWLPTFNAAPVLGFGGTQNRNYLYGGGFGLCVTSSILFLINILLDIKYETESTNPPPQGGLQRNETVFNKPNKLNNYIPSIVTN